MGSPTKRFGAPSRFAKPLLCIESIGIRTEVTLPQFDRDPRLFFIWMYFGHLSRTTLRSRRPPQLRIHACSLLRITERSDRARILRRAERRQMPATAQSA